MQMAQNEKSPNFSNFCTGFFSEFCSDFSPNFLRIFRALFPGKRRPLKIHQEAPPFFNAKSLAGKVKEKITKVSWRAGKLRYSAIGCYTWKTKSDRVYLYPIARIGRGIAPVPLSKKQKGPQAGGSRLANCPDAIGVYHRPQCFSNTKCSEDAMGGVEKEGGGKNMR